MPWTGLEGPAFTAGPGGRHPDPGQGRCCPAVLPRLRRLRTGGETVTADLAEPDAVRMAVAQMEVLAADLAGRGFQAHVSRDGGTLSLNVINRAAPGSRENIAARLADDGSWWFWWPWGDRIARITEVEAAAFKIAYLLTPQAGS